MRNESSVYLHNDTLVLRRKLVRPANGNWDAVTLVCSSSVDHPGDQGSLVNNVRALRMQGEG